MATALNNRSTGSSNSTDSDRIEVVSDEVSRNVSPQPTIIPISLGEYKRKDRRYVLFLVYRS